MTTPYLHSDHFPNSSPAAAAQLAEDLEHLLAADYRGDLYAMLAGWLKAGRLAPSEVFVVEPADALRTRAAALGWRGSTSRRSWPRSVA